MKTIAGTHLRELYHSKQTGMHFACIAPNVWQHVDATTERPAQVGPQYKTRSELLADSIRYCSEYGII